MGVPAPLGVATPGVPGAGDVANAVLSGTISGIGPTQPIAIRGAMNLALWASINTALTTTAGSLSATVASATGLAVGDAIKSTLVPPGSTIGALSGTTVTLAVPPVTYYGVSRKSPEAQIINLPVTAGLLGATVSGANIPAGDTVASIAQAAVAPNANWPGVPGIVNLTTGPSVDAATPQPVPFTFQPNGNAVLAGGTDANAIFTGSAIEYTGTVQLEISFDGGNTWIVDNIGGSAAIYTNQAAVTAVFGQPEREVLYRLNCTAYSSGTINYRLSATGGAAEALTYGPL